MATAPIPTQGPQGMTYNTLVDDIKRYVERGDALDQNTVVEIPRIINNAERDIAEELKVLGYLAPYTATMKIEEPRIAKPENWRSTVSVNFGTGDNNARRKTLRARSYEYMRAIYPDNTQLGEPVYITDYDFKHWLVLPAPNQAYPFEAIVWRLPPLLSPANQTNWLTDLQPNLLLYTSLKGLEAFLKNDARVMMWKGFADERKAVVTGTDKQKMVDRAQMRSTP